MQLTAEQIQENYQIFLTNIETYIESPRKEALLTYYKSIEDHLVLAPASIRETYHNCLPGGYVDHINRVVKASLQLSELWSQHTPLTFTQEELIFAAINHDLGKLGLGDKSGVFPNDNDWQVKNQGVMYKINTALTFSTVPDRTLFILQSIGVPVTENEYLGIKLHDGLYDESNKPYLMSYQNEARLRTSLPLILHQADLLATRVEWERVWMERLTSGITPSKPKPKSFTSVDARKEAVSKIGKANPGLANILKNL